MCLKPSILARNKLYCDYFHFSYSFRIFSCTALALYCTVTTNSFITGPNIITANSNNHYYHHYLWKVRHLFPFQYPFIRRIIRFYSNSYHPYLSSVSSSSPYQLENMEHSVVSTDGNIATNYENSIDKSIFDKKIDLVALKIPIKTCTQYMTLLKDYLFTRPKMKRVYECKSDPNSRLLLLSENILSLTLDGLPNKLLEVINSSEVPITAEYYSLTIGYDYLSVEEVLRQLLPSSVEEIPSSFEQIGHIAHLNLREEQLPYKNIIGQVILDKNPQTLRTVVNKIGQIETEFRTFPMEVIAGEENMIVTVKESNARFMFNFRDVYWNSRLQAEHDRVIELISSSYHTRDTKVTDSTSNKKHSSKKQNTDSPKDMSSFRSIPVVADMMAGVGPFAVPLAMSRNVTVFANDLFHRYIDLNPASYEYLVMNSKANHCSNNLHCFNMDGRDFILDLAAKNIAIAEVIMNLPQNAYEFVDVFIGYSTRYISNAKPSILPRIHCYSFSTADDPILDVAMRIADVLTCNIEDMNYIGIEKHDITLDNNTAKDNIDNTEKDSIENEGSIGSNKRKAKRIANELRSNIPNSRDVCWGHIVRDVSPKKVMVCLTFQLPYKVSIANPIIFPSVDTDSINHTK